MLLLSHHDVVDIVGRCGVDGFMDQLIASLRDAFACKGEHDQRVRDGFRWVEPEGLLEWMPIHRPGHGVHVKLVSYVPQNPSTAGIPTIHAAIVRVDTDSGRVAVLADGHLATALRTGAASAIATDLLAPPDVTTLGMIGCGAQALTQAHAITRVRPIREMLVHDICAVTLRSFTERAAFLGLEIRAAKPEQILARCRVICTATSVAVGSGPVLTEAPFLPDLHINAVGSDFPGKLELPRALLDAAFVVPDLRDQAAREGECQTLAPEQIGPELAELVRAPGLAREHVDRLTVFDSTGIAIEDAVVLDLLETHARSLGIGTSLEMAPRPRDPKHPYEALVSPARVATGESS